MIELLIGIGIGIALREFWPQEKTALGKGGQWLWAKVKAKLGWK